MVIKSLLNTVCSLVFFAFFYIGNASAATYNVSGLFSTYDPASSLIAEESNTPVTGTYDDVTGMMSLSSVEPFFGLNWTVDGDIITTPGSYDVNTGEGWITGIEVGEGQWFGHLLYDWGATQDTDLVLVWDVSHQLDGSIELISTDVISDFYPAGSGAPGHPVIDGSTVSFTYNYDLLLTPVPLPATLWLFVSGLLGLIHLSWRR